MRWNNANPAHRNDGHRVDPWRYVTGRECINQPVAADVPAFQYLRVTAAPMIDANKHTEDPRGIDGGSARIELDQLSVRRICSSPVNAILAPRRLSRLAVDAARRACLGSRRRQARTMPKGE